MKRSLALLFSLLLVTGARAEPLLLQQPTVNQTHVVFALADDLWSVPRAGGTAMRLTSGPGLETGPHFSPDGKWLAFTADYEGNLDVYVMPAAGGQPRRLTWHPGVDRVVGWSPDSQRILFNSLRHDHARTFSGRLFTVPVLGGSAEQLPLPLAHHGCYSPDGQRLAYVPHRLSPRVAWKRYRGGTTSLIWLANLKDSSVAAVPRKDSNDFNPLWVGDSLYFLSDRDGPTTLYRYEIGGKAVHKVINNQGEDLKSAAAGLDCIVYEQFGALHLLDLKTEKSQKLDIRISADLPAVQPRTVKASKYIQNYGLSPTGVRAVFEARGEILTLPAKKGDSRNLTRTPGTAERDPAWSSDGKWIAYFSDAGGEYELHLRDQGGLGEVKKFALGKAPSFYYDPVWSPDSKKIAYSDVRQNLWLLDLDTNVTRLIDTQTYYTRGFDQSWSPDSQWLTYSKNLRNHLRAVFVHSIPDRKNHQVTDGMSDARFPIFDRNGKYLYFAASTDIGPALGGIEMSNFNYPVTRNIYLAVLDRTLPSPLAPESDEEKGTAAEEKPAKDPVSGEPKAKGKKAPAPVKLDLERLDQRILALPLPAKHYVGLLGGKEGILFLVEGPIQALTVRGASPKLTIQRFDLSKRKSEPLVEGISGATVSADGEKLLYRQKDKWFLIGTAAAPKPGEGALKVEEMEIRVDPRAEWQQMYREVWRIERDFLYDPGFHGLDLKAAAKRYEPYLASVGSRRDLNYLFTEMLSDLSLGHVYIVGGDSSEVKSDKTGLLGADFASDQGRYRIKKIFSGENWNPELRAPLTAPGVNVQTGDYLLAINGAEVKATDNLFRFLEGTAGRATVLRVGPKADGMAARDVTVIPVADELALRNRAWIEHNRRQVAEATKGRAAYVYLPDTTVGGYTNFNRYFFAQVGKEAVIIDERFNGGGKAADWIVDRLGRPLVNLWSTRYGEDYTTPAGQIFGPKVMLVNEQAGSGGDYLPWVFKRHKLGPTVGKRTWGGLVGIGGYPALVDGGTVTAPHFAFWSPEGEWEVENRGVAPDVEVEFDPKAWRLGRDPQLEKAIDLVLQALEKQPPQRFQRPRYPNYHLRPAVSALPVEKQ